MATKEQIRKAEWINNMTKEFEGLEEGPKVEIHLDLLELIQEKYQTGKCQATMEYMVYCSRNLPPFNSTINQQMLTRSTCT